MNIDAILRNNPEYVESLYQRYLDDADSVEPTWAAFFAGWELADAWSPGGDGRARSRAAPDGHAAPACLTEAGALPEGVAESSVAPALRIYDLVYTTKRKNFNILNFDLFFWDIFLIEFIISCPVKKRLSP